VIGPLHSMYTAVENNPTAVDVIGEVAIAESFKEQAITWKIDKAVSKRAIQSGENVAEARRANGKVAWCSSSRSLEKNR